MRAGEGRFLITGADRLDFRNCAGFVAGSDLSVSRDDLVVSPRRTGVDGAKMLEDDGVAGVGMAEIDECAEWPPTREPGRR